LGFSASRAPFSCSSGAAAHGHENDPEPVCEALADAIVPVVERAV
jgi:hypothetical protein